MNMGDHIKWVSLEQVSTVLHSSKWIPDIKHHNNTFNSLYEHYHGNFYYLLQFYFLIPAYSSIT